MTRFSAGLLHDFVHFLSDQYKLCLTNKIHVAPLKIAFEQRKIKNLCGKV